MALDNNNDDRSEIAFFDVETTVPTRSGQGYALLEFGSILVCPKKLVELRNYSTLIRPADLNRITTLSVRCNGISKDAVVAAPSFADIADVVYDILHGRIWAGHNILRFDCPRIREAFAEINRPPPEPKGTIDSLALLTQRFGRRAGNMKMATLATYFGLGEQTHRSLDDVRMNLEVLKYCATVLFLESSLPDIYPESSWASPSVTTRSRANGRTAIDQGDKSVNKPSSSIDATDNLVSPLQMEANHPILSLMSPNTGDVNLPLAESSAAREDSFNLVGLSAQIGQEALLGDAMEEETTDSTGQDSSTAVGGNSHSLPEFLELNDISTPSISAHLAPRYRGTQKIQILHRSFPLQISCPNLKIRFGISTKFVDSAGRPRLSFVVDASPSLCNILDASDGLAQKFSVDSGSLSEWRPVVTRKPGFVNSPTVRLQLPTITDGNVSRWVTEIYQNDISEPQKLVFSRYDVTELEALFTPGNYVDVCFSIDTYDFMQNSGIRLVAKKLVIH